MDGDLIDEFVINHERGWDVWVLAYPNEAILPNLPKGWVQGIEKHHAERQVLAFWDPTRYEHPKSYDGEGLTTIFRTAEFCIKLKEVQG